MITKFSVLMSVYVKESPVYLKESLDSVFEQTVPPSEVVLIKDGVLTEALEAVISDFEMKYKGTLVSVSRVKNQGLGLALRLGLEKCSNELVFRMDTDDICHRQRFENQLTFINNNPRIDVLGTCIEEFAFSIGDISRKRMVPEFDNDIKCFHKKRNAMNHMTVLFRKSKVLKAGNYEKLLFFEDYYLWAKMMSMGMIFHNLKECLVYARIGNDMIGRRHGVSYLKREFSFYRKLVELNFINYFEFLKIMILRIPIRVLPKRFVNFIYSYFLR